MLRRHIRMIFNGFLLLTFATCPGIARLVQRAKTHTIYHRTINVRISHAYNIYIQFSEYQYFGFQYLAHARLISRGR